MSFIPSNNKIVNINSANTKNNNTIIKADGGYFTLKFYKEKGEFYDPKVFIGFVKNVEKLVRTSDEYKAYINYLKTEIGLNYCSVMGNITDEKTDIEMHHGPIFTLFDIVSIIVEHMLLHEEQISTFSVAKKVLDEHFENHVQVVMLCKTAHELVHSGKIFISTEQAFGDVNAFIEKYGDGMSDEQIDTFNKYVELSEKNKTTDNGYLRSDIHNWNIENLETLNDENIIKDGDEE